MTSYDTLKDTKYQRSKASNTELLHLPVLLIFLAISNEQLYEKLQQFHYLQTESHNKKA